MKANQCLLVCESLMERLDVALDHAAADVECTAAVEEQIRRLVSHLERTHQRLDAIEAVVCRRDGPMLGSQLAANENPRVCPKASISQIHA
jgi:hypothetical protein